MRIQLWLFKLSLHFFSLKLANGFSFSIRYKNLENYQNSNSRTRSVDILTTVNLVYSHWASFWNFKFQSQREDRAISNSDFLTRVASLSQATPLTIVKHPFITWQVVYGLAKLDEWSCLGWSSRIRWQCSILTGCIINHCSVKKEKKGIVSPDDVINFRYLPE